MVTHMVQPVSVFAAWNETHAGRKTDKMRGNKGSHSRQARRRSSFTGPAPDTEGSWWINMHVCLRSCLTTGNNMITQRCCLCDHVNSHTNPNLSSLAFIRSSSKRSEMESNSSTYVFTINFSTPLRLPEAMRQASARFKDRDKKGPMSHVRIGSFRETMSE